VDVVKWEGTLVIEKSSWDVDNTASTWNIVEVSLTNEGVVGINEVVIGTVVSEVDWETAWDDKWTLTSLQVNNGLLDTVDTTSNILSQTSGSNQSGCENSRELHDLFLANEKSLRVEEERLRGGRIEASYIERYKKRSAKYPCNHRPICLYNGRDACACVRVELHDMSAFVVTFPNVHLVLDGLQIDI